MIEIKGGRMSGKSYLDEEDYIESPLEALQDLSKLVFIHGGVEQYKIIEKALKVLEIIKKCKKVIYLRKEYDEELYTPEEIEKEGGQKYYLTDGSDGYRRYELTQEQYNLLKEVLL